MTERIMVKFGTGLSGLSVTASIVSCTWTGVIDAGLSVYEKQMPVR